MPRGKSSTVGVAKMGHNRAAQNDSTKLKPESKRKLSIDKAKQEKAGDNASASKKKKFSSDLEEITTVPKQSTVTRNLANNKQLVTAPNQPNGKDRSTTTTRFREDDNFVKFEVTGASEDFPSDEDNPDVDQDTASSQSDNESEAEEGELDLSQNNNATLPCSLGAVNPVSHTNEEDTEQNVSLTESFAMMQDFLFHKGVLCKSMGKDDLEEFLEGVKLGKGGDKTMKMVNCIKHGKTDQDKTLLSNQAPPKQQNKGKTIVPDQTNLDGSSLVVTIYRNVVQHNDNIGLVAPPVG